MKYQLLVSASSWFVSAKKLQEKYPNPTPVKTVAPLYAIGFKLSFKTNDIAKLIPKNINYVGYVYFLTHLKYHNLITSSTITLEF